jgi:hypothetical protein
MIVPASCPTEVALLSHRGGTFRNFNSLHVFGACLNCFPQACRLILSCRTMDKCCEAKTQKLSYSMLLLVLHRWRWTWI